MSDPANRLSEDLEQALPGRGRRRWDQAAVLRLVEQPAQVEPVLPATGPPALASELERAREAVRWALDLP